MHEKKKPLQFYRFRSVTIIQPSDEHTHTARTSKAEGAGCCAGSFRFFFFGKQAPAILYFHSRTGNRIFIQQIYRQKWHQKNTIQMYKNGVCVCECAGVYMRLLNYIFIAHRRRKAQYFSIHCEADPLGLGLRHNTLSHPSRFIIIRM